MMIETMGVKKTSDVITSGMYSLRKPAPDPSSRTGPASEGNSVTIDSYHS